jgi:hypothetical protein
MEDPSAADESESTDDIVKPASISGCREVTASSIPVYSTATSYTVTCYFYAGDVFEWLLYSNAGGGYGRYLTWCPRHTSPDQGVYAWAIAAGTTFVFC